MENPYVFLFPILLERVPADLCVVATDNIDYNSLKHYIKVHTTRSQGTAITIPGHQDAALSKFEDGLFEELCRQHDRVDLFVSSKADEIARRLRMCSLILFPSSHCYSIVTNILA